MNKTNAFTILLIGLGLGSVAVLSYYEPPPTEYTITLVLSGDSTVSVQSLYSEQYSTKYNSPGIYFIVLPRRAISISFTSDIIDDVEYVKLDGVDITKVKVNNYPRTSGYAHYNEIMSWGWWDIYIDDDHTVEISQIEAKPVQITYVASVNSNVFHSPSCYYVDRITAGKVYFDSWDSAIESGRRPCKVC